VVPVLACNQCYPAPGFGTAGFVQAADGRVVRRDLGPEAIDAGGILNFPGKSRTGLTGGRTPTKTYRT